MIDLIRDNIPDIRFLKDMKDFVFDVKWAETAPNLEMYYMYRGLAKDKGDDELMANNDLRYNITVLAPRMLGAEFPKTIGHEHGLVPDTNVSYPEMYGVLEGEAIYLLQKRQNGKVIDIYAVRTQAGEKCVIPPDYGHVTINASGKELIMCDWSERNYKSDYSLFKNNRGAAYYALKANDNIKWQKNENYSETPELKIYEAKDFNWLFERFGLDMKTPMYDLISEIKRLNFLKHPQNYNWEK